MRYNLLKNSITFFVRLVFCFIFRQAEKSIESFKYQLFEIENSIEDQSLQINSTMANIIENEGKLYKMVLDV